jgi:energy-coupling factor transporter ATP-binding protein EcfA2
MDPQEQKDLSNKDSVYVGPHVLRDLDIDGLLKSLPTQTVAGNEALLSRLSNPIDDVDELAKRQAQIKAIRASCKTTEQKAKIAAARQTLKDTEADVISVGTAASDPRHAEYYTQILWPVDSKVAFLNKFDWFNEAIVFFRTIFLPGLSVILPIFVFIAPFIFYNLVLKEPLTFEGYYKLLNESLKKAMPSVLGKPRFAGSGGILEFGEQFVHIGISVAMFGASIWNQVSAAFSMRAVVSDMRRRAHSVLAFSKATSDLAALLGHPLPADLVAWSSGELGLFGHAWNEPERVKALLKAAGELDMLAAISVAKRTCFPSLVGNKASKLTLTDLYHPGVAEAKRVYNSLTLGGDKEKNHVLLTGPNRGGKSTLLKSIGSAILMAQTVGIVFAKSATLPVFQNVITALSPQDVVGKLSLFEAEIEFAKDVKARLADSKGPTFLMMDEIFHGTNAHDGVEASQVFLDQLYNVAAKDVFSVVSTHYMDLPARYGCLSPAVCLPPAVSSDVSGSDVSGAGFSDISGSKDAKVQTLCMDSSVDPADPDRLIYSYRVIQGVNRFSSVREILRERGLLTSTTQARKDSECVTPIKKTTEERSKV